MILEEFIDEAYQTSVDKGWESNCAGNIDKAGMKLALIHSEISEALEEIRNGHPYDEIYYSSDGKPEGVPIELADALIRIFDFCKANGINLVRALEIKQRFNKTRPYKHGGKLA